MSRDIKPTEFQSPEQQQAVVAKRVHAASRFWPTVVIAGLILLALLILFYLPQQLSNEPQLSATLPASQSDAGIGAQAANSIEAPFSDAQLLRARREAQEILAELIALQNQLEGLEVERWARDRYLQVSSSASAGDEAYKNREFDQALELYGEARSAAQELLSARAAEAERILLAAAQALSAGNQAQAVSSYELALLLNPDNDAAQQGLKRAQVLDRVNTLMVQAASHVAKNELDKAEQLLLQIEQLDPQASDAGELLQKVQSDIRERDFRQLLADGFNAMAAGDYAAAEIAFSQAERLIPGRDVVKDALLQVASAAETGRRSALSVAASQAEDNEDWLAAVQAYTELLERDPSNIQARSGLLRAQTRLELDQKIENFLANPLQLQSDEVWNSAERALADAQSIQSKSPRLQQQIEELTEVIQRARTPVNLTLVSDGITQVEIYRVGKIGKLQNQTISLYPGYYVLVGKRSGYQDVRKELQITGELQDMSLEIIASEPVI